MRALIALVAVFSLAACSSNSSSDSEPVTDSTTSSDSVVDTTDTTADTSTDIVSTWEVVPSATMSSTTQDVPYQQGMESDIPPDGEYWGTLQVLHGSDAPTAVAELVKLYSGDACYEYAEMTGQAPEDMCTNDFGVVDYPRAIVTIADDAFVSVITETGSESWPTESYVISAADVSKLVMKAAVDNQPAAYDYIPYPYLFTITDGIVTRAEQVWIP